MGHLAHSCTTPPPSVLVSHLEPWGPPPSTSPLSRKAFQRVVAEGREAHQGTASLPSPLVLKDRLLSLGNVYPIQICLIFLPGVILKIKIFTSTRTRRVRSSCKSIRRQKISSSSGYTSHHSQNMHVGKRAFKERSNSLFK